MEFTITESLTENPSISLNMIVKNESHIILKTLEKLCSKIKFSYWVICDTGSTDNTKEIINDFFKSKNINGELYVDEWKNFAHNRT
jgi:glycosyltransferase involved in cell wall biosynthesis